MLPQPALIAAVVFVMSTPPDTTELNCTNCKCRLIDGKDGFDDWCASCNTAQNASLEYNAKCDRQRFPRPPQDPLARNSTICPCGFFAVRHRPLPRPGKENKPVHMMVTVPITEHTCIVVCLICEKIFKHHRNAVVHLRTHHAHYHDHHEVQK